LRILHPESSRKTRPVEDNGFNSTIGLRLVNMDKDVNTILTGTLKNHLEDHGIPSNDIINIFDKRNT
jgi:hypothetical protein